MAWIKAQQALRDHRKILAVAGKLEIEPAHAVGLLILLWLWAVDNAPNSDLTGIPPRSIARAAQWDGNPDDFLKALQAAQLLDGSAIHDWDDHVGTLIEKREADAERKRKERENKQG
ncbi:MAG: hypothetical protein FWC27_08920 [Firmicutes bacterium]|nr:hypothetical protein [Bacillota bacterium]